MIDLIKCQNHLITDTQRTESLLPFSTLASTLSLPHLLPCCCHSDRWVQTQNNFAAEKKEEKNPLFYLWMTPVLNLPFVY